MSLRNEMSKEDEDWEQLSVLCTSNENLNRFSSHGHHRFFPLLFFSLFVVSLTTSPSKSDCRKIPCRRRMERIWMSETYERDSSPFVVVAKSELLNYLPVHFPSIPHHCCGVHVNGKISALTSELNNYNLWFMQSRSLFIVFCMQFMPIDNRFWSAANCCHIWCGIVEFIFNCDKIF